MGFHGSLVRPSDSGRVARFCPSVLSLNVGHSVPKQVGPVADVLCPPANAKDQTGFQHRQTGHKPARRKPTLQIIPHFRAERHVPRRTCHRQANRTIPPSDQTMVVLRRQQCRRPMLLRRLPYVRHRSPPCVLNPRTFGVPWTPPERQLQALPRQRRCYAKAMSLLCQGNVVAMPRQCRCYAKATPLLSDALSHAGDDASKWAENRLYSNYCPRPPQK